MTLLRALENILSLLVAEAVVQSYAKKPWNFGEGKREGLREIAHRLLMPKFRANVPQGHPKVT
jgi:hypothetical protein